LALRFLSLDSSTAVIANLFHLTLVQNTGIAFGLFRRHEMLLFSLITISLVILFIWGSRSKSPSRTARFGIALILGGAIGNWIDRIRFGAVIDFLDFRVWPVFNVADSAITVGVFLYLILIIKEEQRKKKNALNNDVTS